MNTKFFDLNSEKQDKIINASLEIFAKNGYKHASTDEIVKSAGISKGLLFHYFDSKSGLYSYLVDYSVKYLMYEYDRVVGEENEYFAYHEKIMKAKMNVLRTYPYMALFVQGALTWHDGECSEEALGVLSSYKKAMGDFEASLKRPKLRNGLDMYKVDNILKYIEKGLTDENLKADNFQPDSLYSQISEYTEMVRLMSVEN